MEDFENAFERAFIISRPIARRKLETAASKRYGSIAASS
jgi:hypothetical protein